MGGITDIILADVAVEPVREVEVPVVHREQEVGDQRWNWNRPACQLHGRNTHDLIACPPAVGLGPVPLRATQCRPPEATRALRIMMRSDIQRNTAYSPR